VYRVSLETHLDDVTRRTSAFVDAWLKHHQETYDATPTAADRQRADQQAQWTEGRQAWGYNEVVAWVSLLHDGPGRVIKGYASVVGKNTFDGLNRPRSRYQRGFKPYPFVWGYPMMKVLEEWFDKRLTDTAIHEQLRTALLQVTLEDGVLKRRHVDLTAFDQIAPHVRWNDLMGEYSTRDQS